MGPLIAVWTVCAARTRSLSPIPVPDTPSRLTRKCRPTLHAVQACVCPLAREGELSLPSYTQHLSTLEDDPSLAVLIFCFE